MIGLHYQFGLIGYPVKHSLSPWIHRHFLEQTGLEGKYSIIEISPDSSFSEEMARLKTSSVNGFNVTVPYKEKIIPYLDELDEQAKQIGAVNTVINEAGKWVGYNTDGIGYLRALHSHYPTLETKMEMNILILGAGGAAKGIIAALLQHGYRNVTIANRSIERAKNLATANERISVSSLAEVEESLHQYELIIQTSSVGMKPNTLESIISLQTLEEGTVVSDIVYQPLMTTFLKEAAAKGAHIHFGHTMLLYQAQYAFEIWTGKRPIIGSLEDTLKKQLEG